MKFTNFKRYGNLYAGILFLIIAGVYAVQFPNIRVTPIGHIDSRAYPRMVLILLVVLSLALIVTSIMELRKTRDQANEEPEKKDFICVLITILLSTAYVATLQFLGFLIGSALYIYLQILNLCPQGHFKPLKHAAVAFLSAFFVYTFFRYGLTLILPTGLLTGIF